MYITIGREINTSQKEIERMSVHLHHLCIAWIPIYIYIYIYIIGRAAKIITVYHHTM